MIILILIKKLTGKKFVKQEKFKGILMGFLNQFKRGA